MKVFLESIDVARRLGVSTDRVRQLADTGELQPVARTARGVRLFETDDVVRLLRERVVRGVGTIGPWALGDTAGGGERETI
jgi:DNA-binding transcriptional MerR regulator